MTGAFGKSIFDGSRFHIPGHRGAVGFADLLKWRFSRGRANWPRRIDNKPYPPPPRHVEGRELQATWIGQSTVLIQTAGVNILTDPFLSERASPVAFAGPKRVRAPALHAENLPPIDVILISHNHYDHMDLSALNRLARHHRARILTPLGNGRYVRPAADGLPIDELDWTENRLLGDVRITLTPALHWSRRGFSDANRALWGAFAIETPAGLAYFAGDTGFGDGAMFEAIRSHFGPPRLALLPIGGYEPRWFTKPQHMNPEEAVAAHLLLGSGTSLAIHHSTIQLTDEAIDEPKRKLADSLLSGNVAASSFLVPEPGETVLIP